MSIQITRDSSGIVTCLLDNPTRRNALNSAMLQALCETFEAAANDTTIRVVIVRGTRSTFCAGRDLRELDTRDSHEDDIADRLAPVTRLARAVHHCPVPTIAVIEGKAVGLGVALASWCDLVLAVDDAAFHIPEARAGIVPTFTAVSLSKAIGRRQAQIMCLSGAPISADAAKQHGLVQQTCLASELDERIEALCLAVLQGGPQALRLCKDLIARTDYSDFDTAIDRAAALSLASMESAEALEGMQAIRDKQPASWAPTPERKNSADINPCPPSM